MANIIHLDDKDKKYLLALARNAIKEPEKHFDPISEQKFLEKRGVFVTLTKNNQLRGCIGYIMPIASIFQSIVDCARSAAYNDPRFSPVKNDEIDEICIEISVLSLPKPLEYNGWENLLSKLKGNEGIILKKGHYSSTFLPQVWEQLPDKKEFLTNLSMKAGLGPDSWKEGVEIEYYYVEKFSEKELP